MVALARIEDVEVIVGRDIDGDDVARVERLIEFVSAPIVRRLPAVSFVAVTGASVVVRPRNGRIWLPMGPVTAVSSVTVGSDLVDPAAYDLTASGRLVLLDADALPSASGRPAFDGTQRWPSIETSVVYDYGFDEGEPPDDLALVSAEIVAAKWLGGAARAEGVASEAIDSYKVAFYTSAAPGVWLPEHQGIIHSYRVGGIA
jgi:hypothetical protein